MQALLTRLMPPTRVTFCAMQASHLSSSGYVSASAARIVFSCEPYTPHTMQAESSRQLCLSFSRLPPLFLLLVEFLAVQCCYGIRDMARVWNVLTALTALMPLLRFQDTVGRELRLPPVV